MSINRKEQFREELINDPYFGDAVRFILSKLGDIRGKVVLDSGCGAGKMSAFFALHGAKVIGIDKDANKLIKAVRLAKSLEVASSCFFVLGSSEASPIGIESIDIVFSRSTIQYMEREKVLNEYIRILKPNGNMALIENLPYNPLINFYRIHRKLTARTQQQQSYVESINGYIKFRDLNRLKERFRFADQRHYHLFRMASIYLTEKLPRSAYARRVDYFFGRVDAILVDSAPFLRKLTWFVAMYYEGKQDRSR